MGPAAPTVRVRVRVRVRARARGRVRVWFRARLGLGLGLGLGIGLGLVGRMGGFNPSDLFLVHQVDPGDREGEHRAAAACIVRGRG